MTISDTLIPWPSPSSPTWSAHAGCRIAPRRSALLDDAIARVDEQLIASARAAASHGRRRAAGRLRDAGRRARLAAAHPARSPGRHRVPLRPGSRTGRHLPLRRRRPSGRPGMVGRPRGDRDRPRQAAARRAERAHVGCRIPGRRCWSAHSRPACQRLPPRARPDRRRDERAHAPAHDRPLSRASRSATWRRPKGSPSPRSRSRSRTPEPRPSSKASPSCATGGAS